MLVRFVAFASICGNFALFVVVFHSRKSNPHRNAAYEDGKLIIKQSPIDPKTTVKSQIVHREIVGEEMVIVSKAVCTVSRVK
jgi:hypothetical protein